MNTAKLKKLADKCICHPVSRSISDVENAGEAIKELLAINAELVEALKLCFDHCRLYNLNAETNNVGKAVRAALAKAEGGEM